MFKCRNFEPNLQDMAKKYDLKLKGYVGGWDFDADYVDWFLNKNKDKELTIVIDSLGGSVTTAMSVAAAIKMHGNVKVHYVGYNASAATIVSMNAKHISIDTNAMYLVHKCSQFVCKFAQCNSDEMQRMIDGLEKSKRDLEKIDMNIAGMYAARCKKPKDQLLKLMSEGGWLSAKEAKDWGFVDEITDEEVEDTTVINDVVVASLEEAGIPVPPGFEAKRVGFFRRVKDAFSQIFDNQPTNIINTMAKILPLICAALAIESLKFNDGKAEITEAQADTIEKLLADKDKEIADLKADITAKDQQIENLKKQPADDTKNIIDESKPANNDPDDFNAVAQRAREMFNAIS